MKAFMLICFGGLIAAGALQVPEDEATRKIWDTAFIIQGKQKTGGRRYRIVTPEIPVKA